MLSATPQTAAGYITVVQEQRFRLVTDTGQGFLLTLAHNAPVGENDLQPLACKQYPIAALQFIQ